MSRQVRRYRDEASFWSDILEHKLYPGDLIQIENFQLSLWVPRVPGLYWKGESRKIRDAARKEQLSPGIYNPVGKTMHIMGGMGTIRLLPSVSGRLVCASSSGYYWKGVPVLIQGDAWHAYREISTGLTAQISGILAEMPREYAQMLGGHSSLLFDSRG